MSNKGVSINPQIGLDDGELVARFKSLRVEERWVEILNLRSTKVTDAGLASVAEHCSGLLTLDLGFTFVTDKGMQAIAEYCKGLQSLDLRFTKVKDAGLLALAKCCSGLRALDLRFTDVTDVGLRAVVEHCTKLQSLDISGTGVTDTGLQAVAKHCKGLLEFTPASTSMTDAGLRVVAEQCTKLQSLNLTSTDVTDEGLRAVAEQCTELRWIYLGDTRVNLRDELRRSGNAKAILLYFSEARAAGSRPLLEIKLPILGLGRMGKTQLACRLAPQNAEEKANPLVRDAEPTHAFVQRTAKYHVTRQKTSHECLLRFFDFGGQPEMHGAHRFFLADKRNVYIVLVSARKSRAENRIDYWLRMVAHHSKNSPVIVVVSHNDHEPAADERRYREPVERLEPLDAAQLSREHYGLPVKLVEGYSNITGAKIGAVGQAIRESVALLDAVFDEPFNPNFFKVHGWCDGQAAVELQDQPPFERYLHVERFKAVCAAAGQTDAGQQMIWLRLLRDLGLLHYVGDRPEVKRDETHSLRDLIFHPDWVKGPVYNVVRNEEALGNGGVLPFGRLIAAFASNVPDLTDRQRVVALMAGCELIFRVRGGSPDEADYLIVDRVPSTAPNTDRTNWTPSPKMPRYRLSFRFLPDHLLTQLLGRWFARCPERFPYFRDDVVLTAADNPKCRVRIRARVHEYALDMEFDSALERDCERLRAQLERELESILDPEGLHCGPGEWLWKLRDLDLEPETTLSIEDEGTVTALAEELNQVHGFETTEDRTDCRTALRAGFLRSLEFKGEPRRAYRLCWTFACSECISRISPMVEARPVGSSLPELRKVIVWLDKHPALAVLLGGVDGDDVEQRAEKLRGNYRKVTGGARTPSPDEVGSPRHEPKVIDRHRRGFGHRSE